MRRFRKSEYHEVETQLRKARPQPRSEFLSALADDVVRHAPRRAGGRLALAGALSVAMLTMLALLGGIGYAASAVQAVQVSKIARIVGVTPSSSSHAAKVFTTRGSPTRSTVAPAPRGASAQNHHGRDDDDAADDQYKGGKGCGDKNHVHAKKNKCKKKHRHH